MAICTKCGAIINDEDEHVCKIENIPPKGKEIIKGVLVANTAVVK